MTTTTGTTAPVWGTHKTHGRATTLVYFGCDRKTARTEGTRVVVRTTRTLVVLADYDTDATLLAGGVATRFWATPFTAASEPTPEQWTAAAYGDLSYDELRAATGHSVTSLSDDTIDAVIEGMADHARAAYTNDAEPHPDDMTAPAPLVSYAHLGGCTDQTCHGCYPTTTPTRPDQSARGTTTLAVRRGNVVLTGDYGPPTGRGTVTLSDHRVRLYDAWALKCEEEQFATDEAATVEFMELVCIMADDDDALNRTYTDIITSTDALSANRRAAADRAYRSGDWSVLTVLHAHTDTVRSAR